MRGPSSPPTRNRGLKPTPNGKKSALYGAPKGAPLQDRLRCRPLLLLLALLADAVNLERVAGGQVLVLAADLLLDAFDAAGKKLHRTAALGAHHVMMIAPLVLVLVARYPVVERNLTGQPAFGQQLERTVHRGEADVLVPLLDQAVELVGGKMVAGVEEGPKNDVALSGVLKADAFEMAVEDGLSLAHHLARDRRLIVDALLQQGAHGCYQNNTG